jgi:hypothetical protein
MQISYAPLAAFLTAQSPGTATVTLSLPEIEVILGTPLARGASTSAWWVHPNRHRSPGWLAAGWVVRRAGMRTMPSTVTFARAPSASAP